MPDGRATMLTTSGQSVAELAGTTMILKGSAQPTTMTEEVGIQHTGSGPLSIDTSYVGAASATISVNGGAAQPLPSGNASIPVS
jgi:hypothetical protein